MPDFLSVRPSGWLRTRLLSPWAGIAIFGDLELGDSLKKDLVDFYRFAVLLTGSDDRARSAITEALVDPANELPQLRSERHRKAWMVTRIRKTAATASGASSEPARDGFSGLFSTLAEPERSAMALFYLDFLSIRDMAQVLKMEVDDLARVLGEARLKLRTLSEGAGSA